MFPLMLFAQSRGDTINVLKPVKQLSVRLVDNYPQQAQWYNSAFVKLKNILEKDYGPDGLARGLQNKNISHDETTLLCSYAEILSDQAYTLLFSAEFSDAEQLACSAIDIDSSLVVAHINLATALLLQGKHAEAETIYCQYKDELGYLILDDLRQLAEAGVIPREIEEKVTKIKQSISE